MNTDKMYGIVLWLNKTFFSILKIKLETIYDMFNIFLYWFFGVLEKYKYNYYLSCTYQAFYL